MRRQKTKQYLTDSHTVAVVQAASVAFDCKRSLAKALDLIRDTSKKGAKLVLFPEAFLSGYTRDSISAR
jgi:nitrilase